jgi:hypothetical protein
VPKSKLLNINDLKKIRPDKLRQNCRISDKIVGKGSEIEWTITRSTPRGEFTMTYTGKIEGDTMSGEVQMGDFGSSEWKAKKK